MTLLHNCLVLWKYSKRYSSNRAIKKTFTGGRTPCSSLNISHTFWSVDEKRYQESNLRHFIKFSAICSFFYLYSQRKLKLVHMNIEIKVFWNFNLFQELYLETYHTLRKFHGNTFTKAKTCPRLYYHIWKIRLTVGLTCYKQAYAVKASHRYFLMVNGYT